jgi:probable F420-dependent oxidoreductase
MVALARDHAAGAYPYFTTTEHIASIREQLGPEPFLAADLPVVLATDRASARAIGDKHTSRYLRTDNYRNNLARLGWSEEEVQGAGSDDIFDAIVAWGDRDQVAERIRAVFEAGADQVVLNLVTADPKKPYVEELRLLAPQGGGRT